MFGRRRRLLLSAVAIAALLFAQGVAAVQACAAALDTPAMAFADMSGMECADMASQNVCLQQYLAGDQNPGTAQAPVADVPDLVVLTLPESPPERRTFQNGDARCLSSSSSPPPSIRFCSFQI